MTAETTEPRRAGTNGRFHKDWLGLRASQQWQEHCALQETLEALPKTQQPRIEDIWVAHGDSGGEGCGFGPMIDFCYTMEAATEAAKGMGWYGSDGYVCSRACLVLDGTKYFLLDEQQVRPIDMESRLKLRDESIRVAALLKLTPNERRVLGLEYE